MSQRPLSSLSIPPSTLSALTRAGYETIQDLSTSSAEALSKDLNIPLPASQALFKASGQSTSKLPLTQTAASLASAPQASRFCTHCVPVDKLLHGGLPRSHILEVSGPPGTMKEIIGAGIVRSFVENGEGVIFIDCQNMTSPSTLIKIISKSLTLPKNFKSLIHHTNIHTLEDLMIFVNNLPSYLDKHSSVRLLVINSISFPFQSPNVKISQRSALLERIKQALTKACAVRNLTVVLTSQLATKVLNKDGSAGTFDTGSTAVMVPQLGPSYLPTGRTHRIIIHPDSRTSGTVRVLSSPSYQAGNGPQPKEQYVIVRPFTKIRRLWMDLCFLEVRMMERYIVIY